VAAFNPELRLKMRGIVEEGVEELVIDLADVQMVDSSGIGLLISAYQLPAQGGWAFGRDSCLHRDSRAVPYHADASAFQRVGKLRRP
jgi:hypothetical protein